MITKQLRRRVPMTTNFGGAPKKPWAPWRLSDTILSGSRPQVLLYGPPRGRWADQGEWSEGRTAEEDSTPGLEGEVQGEADGEAQVETQVEIIREAFES
jgi:hypothetical protein